MSIQCPPYASSNMATAIIGCLLHEARVCVVQWRFFTWISRRPRLRSWSWLYHKKGNLTQNSAVYSEYGNTVNFSHTSRMHLSASLGLLKPMHAEMPKKCHKPCQKQTLPLEARGLPSNTWMPGPYSTHHAKRQLDRFTHFHTTIPKSLLVIMGCRKFTPQTAPFPSTITTKI